MNIFTQWAAFHVHVLSRNKVDENENENENKSLLIPAVQHDIYHRINFKNKIDLRLTFQFSGWNIS